MILFKKAFSALKTDGEIKEMTAKFTEAIKESDAPMDSKEFSIREMAEATLGADAVAAMGRAHEAGVGESLREAVSPVKLSAFTNITGALLLKAGLESYNSPDHIGSQLVTEESTNEDNERITGVAEIDDDALVVPEDTEYPTMKFGEDYIDVPKSQKRGARIGLTREMIFFDRTGKVIELAKKVGERVATNKEIRILRTVLGVDNTFSRKGVSRNTYVAAADPRINKVASSELLDYSQIEAAEQIFNAYVDDRTTGEPIDVRPDTLLCCKYKEWTAARIAEAREIRIATNTAATQTYGPNPAAGKFKVVTSPWIQWVLVNKGGMTATNARNHWYYGNSKRAFGYRTLFPFAFVAASSHDAEFDRDVVMQWKASERGVPYVKAPWHMAEFYLA